MTEDKEEYLGRFPSESEYIRRIDDISAAIKNGGDGYIESQNLLYDLPYPWMEIVQPDIDKFALELKKSNSANLSPSEKRMNRIMYSLKTKQRVISFLYDVGMWSPRRQKVPESDFVDMHDQKEKEEQN